MEKTINEKMWEILYNIAVENGTFYKRQYSNCVEMMELRFPDGQKAVYAFDFKANTITLTEGTLD